VVVFALWRHDPGRDSSDQHYNTQQDKGGSHKVVACGLSGMRFCGKNEGVHVSEDTKESMARTIRSAAKRHGVTMTRVPMVDHSNTA
jgi:hypothetical protein